MLVQGAQQVTIVLPRLCGARATAAQLCAGATGVVHVDASAVVNVSQGFADEVVRCTIASGASVLIVHTTHERFSALLMASAARRDVQDRLQVRE